METGDLLSLVEDYVSDQREEEIPLIIVKCKINMLSLCLILIKCFNF